MTQLPMRDFIRFTGDNEFPDGITAEEALSILTCFFLGDDYHVVDQVTPEQENVCVVHDILNRFPKLYAKFCATNGWQRGSNILLE